MKRKEFILLLSEKTFPSSDTFPPMSLSLSLLAVFHLIFQQKNDF